MRPVDRGPVPLLADGSEVVYRNYRKARDELMRRLGSYCSYCEMRASDSIDVEHVLPKAEVPELAAAWDNFLLACTSCNSAKSRNQRGKTRDGYFWPDRDNTIRAIAYPDDGLPTSAPGLDARQRAAARATISLTSLARTEDSRGRDDLRLRDRLEAIRLANRAANHLRTTNTQAMRESIVDVAISRGFFSIWMTAFVDADMRRRLIDAFPGTCAACFDADANPLPRAGGSI